MVKLNKTKACCFIVTISGFCPRPTRFLPLDSSGDISPQTPWKFHFAYAIGLTDHCMHGVPWVILTLMRGSAAAKRLKNTAIQWSGTA